MIDLQKEDNGLWLVTLNRPEKANSLTPEMLAQLCDIAEAAHAARALVLTGAGKVFSAGADLDAARAGLATSPLWERLSSAIAALPCLTLAALACDMRIAVPGAKFFYPVMKLGYLPQPSDPGRMAALIGPARTKLILMGGQKISADEALAYGLIERIVPPEDLLQTARDIAADTLAANPDTARAIKAMCGD